MDWFYELWPKLGEAFRGWLESARHIAVVNPTT